jgi:hypothetical protein
MYTHDGKQFLEESPVRGFSSSVDYRLHFGLGNKTYIDSLKIQWPDDKIQLIKNIKANQSLVVKYDDAKEIIPVNAGITFTVVVR